MNIISGFLLGMGCSIAVEMVAPGLEFWRKLVAVIVFTTGIHLYTTIQILTSRNK